MQMICWQEGGGQVFHDKAAPLQITPGYKQFGMRRRGKEHCIFYISQIAILEAKSVHLLDPKLIIHSI